MSSVEELQTAMFNATTATRIHFTEDNPLVVHEPFFGLGGVRQCMLQCKVPTRLGNLTVEADPHFMRYYKSEPSLCNVASLACPTKLESIPFEHVEAAHGIFNFVEASTHVRQL